MPAAVRSTGQSNSGSVTATSFTVTMPAGFAAGDLLIGIAVGGDGAVPATRPSGSTAVQNIVDGSVFNMDIVRKTAVGGDTFTWTVTTARRWAGAVIAVTAGTWNTTTPLQGNTGVAQGTTVSNNFVTTASTPTSADALMIAAFGAQVSGTWANTDTNPAMTEIADTTSTGTAATSLGVYRSNAAPPVSSISRTGQSSISSANGAAFQVYVNPAAVAGLPRLIMAPMRG